MSGTDYIKYFTEQMVKYMNHPEAYRQARQKWKEEKHQRKLEQKMNVYTNRWLGFFPFAFKIYLKNRQQDR